MFANIRIFPTRATKAALITWQLPPEDAAGDVYIAFSYSGVPGSWEVRNPQSPVSATVGIYEDTQLVLNAEHQTGYYRLLLSRGGNDTFSPAVGIFHDLERREYGLAHAIIQKEFLQMRTSDGIPVWHCIPKTFGVLAPNVDPESDETSGPECGETGASYGEKFVGGFYPPVLTWVRPIGQRTIQLTDSNNGAKEEHTQLFRFLAFPKPITGHVLVDPATDRRWLVGQKVQQFLIRDILPVAYEAEVSYMASNDPRHAFPVPQVDLREYRKIPDWSFNSWQTIVSP